MTDAFDAKKADFSRFCNTSTFIEQMKQVARIVVDEKGSEAAAVTVIGSFTTSADSGTALQHVNFHANHPFLYVISEQSTGAILFIGQYFAE
jgi:serpin B